MFGFGTRNGGVTRRDALRLSAAGFTGACGAPWFHALAAHASGETMAPQRPKSCILIWLIGGPPQSLTFDIKGHSAIKPIATAAADVRISEHMSKTARVMQDVTLLRGMRTADSNHGTARYLMHTGFRKGQNGVTHPVLGSIVAHDLGDMAHDLPTFVSVGSPQFGGYGPGHLGPKYAPSRVDSTAGGLSDLKPTGSLAEFDARAGLRSELNSTFAEDHMSKAAQAHQITLGQAARLMHSPKTKAFDVSTEPATLRDAYGRGQLGQSCLLARRLIESGVQFVEVRHSGWDVHKDTVNKTKKLSEEFDPAFATLVTDLKQRGRLNDTLVICMGEFGRNPANGSNHFSRAWTTVLAGGGLKNGRAIGDTGASGGTVEARPITPGDFMATVCTALGIDPKKEWTASNGRPLDKVSKGAEPVRELF
ncbi:DUF1501 domain-containing protein [Fimbriiglobus ruber]|uniref:DUF1501 domain-containing protein n=1 Tax=Fimbriiglobus ruber TaxID=1908690 RepID=A0A225DZM6_9BACT|nr:DUF1501 domain-containing protein [Fimbriiglobus ruber]OWK46423.1 hypothetical protein FRUB_00122 [Fimbriiglobus ruber]